MIFDIPTIIEKIGSIINEVVTKLEI